MKKLNYFLISAVLISSLALGCSKDTIETTTDYKGWETGKVIKDANGWTEVVIGDYPLVLSVPHGGSIKPAEIPDRSCAGSTTVLDTYTIEMARAIQEEFKRKLNKTPFIVISNLSRIKLDQNRDLKDALCADKTLEPTWHFYHNYLDSMLQYSSQKYGKTIFIDLHAHGREDQRLHKNFRKTWDFFGVY